jgi:hypothetical protein
MHGAKFGISILPPPEYRHISALVMLAPAHTQDTAQSAQGKVARRKRDIPKRKKVLLSADAHIRSLKEIIARGIITCACTCTGGWVSCALHTKRDSYGPVEKHVHHFS